MRRFALVSCAVLLKYGLQGAYHTAKAVDIVRVGGAPAAETVSIKVLDGPSNTYCWTSDVVGALDWTGHRPGAITAQRSPHA